MLNLSRYSSPYGSQIKTWIRNFALRFLTQNQRKNLKKIFKFLESTFKKQKILQMQQEEINRLKSRLILLEGKLNLALYGLPTSVPQLNERSLNSLTYFLNQQEKETTDGVSEITWDTQQLEFLNHPLLKISVPRASQILLATSSSHQMPSCIQQMITSENKIYWIYPQKNLLQTLQKKYSTCHFQALSTDCFTGIFALQDISFDILFCTTLHQLSHQEQGLFLKRCIQSLNQKGKAIFILPNLSSPQVAQDLYWSDPKSIRPYSLSYLKQVMKNESGTGHFFEQTQDNWITLLFKKDL